MAKLTEMFRKMEAARASDLHLGSGRKPFFRVDGDLEEVEGYGVLGADEVRLYLEEIAPEENWKEFTEHWDTDFAYKVEGVGRLRANYFYDINGPGAVFRLIPSKVITMEELKLPQGVVNLCHLTKGLVLITGPTGSGKSTTLAAMIDYIIRKRADHIITIEDPVEFVHESKGCLINHREVHKNTKSFKNALRAALREDPDIILIGELRDLETVEIALEVAETGHLVFGTLHTTSAYATVDRIIDQFPADKQSQIRTMLAGALCGVVSQNLCKRKNKGRVAAFEIMLATTAVFSNIREGKTFQLPSVIQTGKKLGMKLMNESLFELVRDGVIDAREAYSKSFDKEDIMRRFQVGAITFEPDIRP
jgi:twitching motility protein PilT